MIKKVLALFAVFCCLSVAYGQIDPHGIMDTLRTADVTAAPGEQVDVAVYSYTDIELLSFTAPIKYPQDVLTFDTISYEGSKLENLSTRPIGVDESAGTILIGGIVIDEDPIPAGNGLLATLKFTVSEAAEAGQSYLFDTLFVPPAGYLLFVTTDHDKVYPAFVAGHLTIVDPNKAPKFDDIPNQVVHEGEPVSFTVNAVDPDGDAVAYSALKLPVGASFDASTGSFSWLPPFVGPNSSAGSPFVLKFTASDGNISGHCEVNVTVLNRNRAPVITASDSTDCTVGDSVSLVISATDPDLEDVEVDVTGLPSGADYQRGNPGYITWRTSLADSGSYELTVTASDAEGATDTEPMTLVVHSAAACDLYISDIQLVSGASGVIDVSLHNRVEIDHMNLLVHYDPTALTLLSATAVGTRVEYWGQFGETINETDGRIWLDAGANLPGHDGIAPLEVGDGPVMKLNFLATSNLDFAGQLVGVSFEFLDQQSQLDNTLVTPSGDLIGRNDIDYANGSVFIKQTNSLIGDINLNAVPFEVGDVVYFTNYFIDPVSYPLDGDRWGNSDVNQDGRPGTIGDLIYLVGIVTGGSPSKIVAAESEDRAALVDMRPASSGSEIYVESSAPVGGAYFVMSVKGDGPIEVVGGGDAGKIDMHWSYDGDLLRVLLLSRNADGIAHGREPVVKVVHGDATKISINEMMLADQFGSELEVNLSKAEQLPNSYELDQNYPNPFNPTTSIGFSLPSDGRISVRIYNIEGRLVTTLVDGLMPAGRHTVVWDGRDNTGRAAASGIYFYRLDTEQFSDTKKMTLIK